MKYNIFIVFLFLCISCTTEDNYYKKINEPITQKVIINVDSVITNLQDVGIGISVNHYAEHSGVVRKTSFSEVAKDLGLKSLRWPEGELAESILWSEPPYDKASPVYSMRGNVWPYNSSVLFDQTTGQPLETLDFDQFISLCNEIEAEPIVIIPIDAVMRPDGVYECVSEERIIENAVEMVKYSKSKGYNVKYWEIGNESDRDISGTKSKQRWTANEYANFVVKLSRLMKEQDNTIMIGANGMSKNEWWETLIRTASSDIDFLVTHQYGVNTQTLGSGDWYEDYKLALSKKWDMIYNVTNLNNAIDNYANDIDKERLKIAITETSSYMPNGDENYCPPKNNFGTALIAFEMMLQMLTNDRVKFIDYWTSHWFGSDNNSVTDCLGKNNEILPSGRIIQILNNAILSKTVKNSYSGPVDKDFMITSFYDTSNLRLNILLVNRSEDVMNISLKINTDKFKNKETSKAIQFKGNSPLDENPTYNNIDNIRTNDQSMANISLEPYSITLLNF